MGFEQWLVFLPACIAMSLSPGPNNFLSLRNGVCYGLGIAVLAGLGRLFAFTILIVLTAVGIGALLASSELAFLIIKWLGVLYLVYLGIRMWYAKVLELTVENSMKRKPKIMVLVQQEFFIAIGNPKAILIFTAILPQFLVQGEPVSAQFTVLGSTFLVAEFCTISFYALSGVQFQFLTQSEKGQMIFNRASGTVLMAAGIFLAMSQSI